jgi:molybdopterin converting factor small subunit
MALINIRFVGPWRMYLGIERFTLKAATVEDALEQVEVEYGPKYHQRLIKGGLKVKRRISDDSNILLNRIHIRQLSDHTLKDGDSLDIIPRFVGG